MAIGIEGNRFQCLIKISQGISKGADTEFVIGRGGYCCGSFRCHNNGHFCNNCVAFGSLGNMQISTSDAGETGKGKKITFVIEGYMLKLYQFFPSVDSLNE